MITPRAAVIVLSAAAWMSPAPVSAGRLSEVTREVARKQAQSKQARADRPDRRVETRDSERRETVPRDSVVAGPRTSFVAIPCTGTCATHNTSIAGTGPGPAPRLELELSVTGQRVIGSEHALHLVGRLGRGGAAGALELSRYVESAPSKRNPEATVSMDLGTALFEVRLLRQHRTQAWLSAGLGFARSHAFDSLAGGALALGLEHSLTRQLGLRGSVRGLFFTNLNAVAYSAGVHASVFRIGYRGLKFDVGPVLHGPEIGVAVQY